MVGDCWRNHRKCTILSLNQADVAKILNISQQYYQCYESGKNELPLRHCITLAQFYNVSIDYIVGITSTPHSLNEKLNPTLEKYMHLIQRFEKADTKTQKIIKLLLDI